MANMYDNSIALSAYNSDTEGWRLRRLDRIVGYICALADHYGNSALLNKISSLNDCKGQLTVKWNSAPLEGEKEIVAKAWSSIIGDGAANVDHKI